MFVGNWVIGPAVSGDPIEHAKLRSAKFERASLAAAVARPDPSPYGTPTPDFGMPAAPQYGALARREALALAGRDSFAGNAGADYGEAPWPLFGSDRPMQRSRYRRSDRHSSPANF
jgi:hypothetical protein